MTTPRVSVVMPVFNAGRFLQPALDSILRQTYSDIEVIALNDGSTDGSGETLDAAAQQDPRLRVIHQTNRGLVETLNRGLELATGDYIARMDADDVSAPSRIAEQVAYLDSHPNSVVVGTQFRIMDQSGAIIGGYENPCDPTVIRWTLLRRSALAHPTVLARRADVIAHGGYEADYAHAEDYALWTRLAIQSDLANLPQTLVDYRWWSGNVSSRYRAAQLENTARIAQRVSSQMLELDLSLDDARLLIVPTASASLSSLSLPSIERIVELTMLQFERFTALYNPAQTERSLLRKALAGYLYPLAVAATSKDAVRGLRLARSIYVVSGNPQIAMRKVAGTLRHMVIK